MRIQHNIMAMNAYRNYNNNTSALSKNLEKLSSGYKINRAGDDAAGLAISEKMRAQITGLEAAQKNVKDGTSLVKTAEGAMQEIHDMLNRMDYLATQSANGTYDNEVDRLNLQKEISSLKSEINRIADSANFNGIKLLDGVSGSGRLSTLPVEYNTLSSAAGVTIDSVTNGGGTKGEFTIDLNKQFSFGDTITINGTDADGNALTATYTLSTATGATNFYGETVEDQATDLVNKMTASFGAHFDIKADGGKITMTAKAEGVEAAVIDSVTTTNANVTMTKDATNSVAGASGTGKTAFKGALEVIGGGGGGGISGNVEVGDKLTFEFTDAKGNKLEATIIADAEMAQGDAAKATDAIVKALNEAHFKDNADTTGVDESQLKVSDLFDLTANKNKDDSAVANGSIYVTSSLSPTVDGGYSATKVTIDRKGTKTEVMADVQAPSEADATAANIKTDKWISDAVATNNFTAGDKVKVTGTLSDGRTFEVTLEAGKDFEVDKNATTATAITKTMANLAEAFKSKDLNVTIKNAAGEEVGTMTGEDLFGAKGEFTVSGASDKLTITSKNAGASAEHAASTITNVEIKPLDDVTATGAVQLTKDLAEAQTSATSQFTLDDKLAYGTAIKVGDKTYEIVADSRDTSSRNNTAIVVKDPSDSAAVAKAIVAAINENEKGSYTAEADGSTVTVKSDKIGSDQVALDVTTPYGDKVKTASFTFDPKNVKEGSVLTFNGNTYEFVKKGGEVKDGNIAIEMADPSKATAKELGDAFAAVVKNGTASVDANGKVTLKGVETEDGKIADPVVTWENNLVLQIGDTADDFNQLSVKLSDMHTTAMGIDGVDIGTQEGAQAAIDVIKDAINYVSGVRGDFGAIQNRLDHTANNLSVMAENIQDAESTIRDTDVASEMMSYVKNNILVQSAQAMLAQANQVPQGVLQLLG